MTERKAMEELCLISYDSFWNSIDIMDHENIHEVCEWLQETSHFYKDIYKNIITSKTQ